MAEMFSPPHPGEVLREWMEGIKIIDLSEAIGAHRSTVSRILNGRAPVTADIAISLEQALGPSREMWVGLQSSFDLWQEGKKPNRTQAKPSQKRS